LSHFVVIESKLFRITNVDISNAVEYVNNDDLRVLSENQLIGKNFFFTNTLKIKNVLLGNFLGAKDISIQKKFPNTILIDVKEREPVAVLKSLNDEKEFIIDLDGYVLGFAGDNFDHLPHINYSDSVRIGEFLRGNIVPLSFTIIREIEENDIKVTTMNFHDRYIELITKAGTMVMISSDKDIKNSIKVVASLDKELNLEGKSIKKIDLRYDKVIVSYD
jgi:cell division septal protein FtsQ